MKRTMVPSREHTKPIAKPVRGQAFSVQAHQPKSSETHTPQNLQSRNEGVQLQLDTLTYRSRRTIQPLRPSQAKFAKRGLFLSSIEALHSASSRAREPIPLLTPPKVSVLLSISEVARASISRRAVRKMAQERT